MYNNRSTRGSNNIEMTLMQRKWILGILLRLSLVSRCTFIVSKWYVRRVDLLVHVVGLIRHVSHAWKVKFFLTVTIAHLMRAEFGSWFFLPFFAHIFFFFHKPDAQNEVKPENPHQKRTNKRTKSQTSYFCQ